MRAYLFTPSVLAAAVLLTPSDAHAGDVISTGVGVLLGGGVVGLSKPNDTTVTAGGVTGQDTTYPGFFGARSELASRPKRASSASSGSRSMRCTSSPSAEAET